MKKILSVITIISAAFFGTESVARAEVVVFQTQRSGVPFKSCMPMSLSENISAKVVGETGKGCEFDVEVKPAGEWVSVGGFFDSPPYAWGSDSYHNVSEGEFSFTCKNANFTFDDESLPSFVTITGQSDIPASSTGGPGKKYTLKIADNASASSFNMNFDMSTDCTMFGKGSNFSGAMTPVNVSAPYRDGCNKSTPIEINPREFAHTQTIRIVGTCGAPTEAVTP